jgi:hypothetical protein
MTQLSLDPPRVGASPASTQPGSGRQPAVGVLKAHNYFRHEAFLFRGEDEFLAGTVPFIRDALRAGQTVMVAVISTHLRLLRSAMGSDAGLVHYLDMAKIGHNPARIIPAWRDFVAEHAAEGQPVCGIGEPIWASRRPAEVNECQLHEALLNFAIEPHTPVRLLCPYDVEALTPDIITEAQRTHPVMLESQDHQRSTLYSGWRHVETLFETALPTFEGVASHRACAPIFHPRAAPISAWACTRWRPTVSSTARWKGSYGSGPNPTHWCARSMTTVASPIR